ncbi:MAG: alpha/beta hydrolase [Bacteroidota bacterium]
MKPRLLLLSDLWGREKADWTTTYLKELSPYFECQYYDCCELGRVDKSVYEQERLHQQFVNGGIERAVRNLLDLEKKEVFILAFSIGGTIAWKAALKGLPIKQLWAISATRLRHEPERPSIPIHLIYGAKDDFRPSLNWLERMNVSYEIVAEQGHNLYYDHSYFSRVLKASGIS